MTAACKTQCQVFVQALVAFGLLLPAAARAEKISDGAEGPVKVQNASGKGKTVLKKRRVQRLARDEQAPFGLQRMSFEIAAAQGSYASVNYTEFSIGLNSYFRRWLSWRNALFARMPKSLQNSGGLDSSLRGVFGIDAVAVYGGLGYRLAVPDGTAPIAEAGINIGMTGISLGAGVKFIFDRFLNHGQNTDTEVFVTLSSGGAN